MDKKRDIPFREKLIAGVGSGIAAAGVKELFNIDAAGGSTGKLMEFLGKTLKTPDELNFHAASFLTKKLPNVGASTLTGLVAYDVLKHKDKSKDPLFKKMLPALGAGALSTAITLPLALKTNAFPAELVGREGSALLKTVIKNRFGQALIAAPVGYMSYDYFKKKLQPKTKRYTPLVAGILAGAAGTATTLPLTAKYEALRPHIDAEAARIGESLKRFHPLFAHRMDTGLEVGHYLGRLALNLKTKIPSGIAAGVAGYTVYDLLKKHFENKKK